MFGRRSVSSSESGVPPENIAVRDAIKRLSDFPTNDNRIMLYRALTEGFLILAAQEIPAEIGQGGPVTLETNVSVQLRITEAPNGGWALLAFTDMSGLANRHAGDKGICMSCRDVLARVIEGGFEGIIINPAGPWAGVPREDVEKILQGIW